MFFIKKSGNLRFSQRITFLVLSLLLLLRFEVCMFVSAVVDCGKPPRGARLQVNVQETTFGAMASYSCEEGYYNESSRLSWCKAHCEKDVKGRQNCSSASGKWSKKPLCRCKYTEIKCIVNEGLASCLGVVVLG